jgi:DNA-binding response OmpR family regulator
MIMGIDQRLSATRSSPNAKTMQTLQPLSPDFENISILLVSPYPKDQTDLRHVLHHSRWNITRAANVGTAALLLQEQAPSVVLCERNLPDGNWKDVLDQASQQENPPNVLVISRHADESLWAEVLNEGGYDVLLKPFDVSEVTRVVRMAWQRWTGRQLRKGAQSATVAEHATLAHA